MIATEPKPMSRTAALSYAIGLPLVLLALIFIPVGRLNWEAGWFFVGFLIIVYGISAIALWRVNPVIYRARSRLQPGTERWDRILLESAASTRVFQNLFPRCIRRRKVD